MFFESNADNPRVSMIYVVRKLLEHLTQVSLAQGVDGSERLNVTKFPYENILMKIF